MKSLSSIAFMMLVVFASWGQGRPPARDRAQQPVKAGAQSGKADAKTGGKATSQSDKKADKDTVKTDYRPTGVRIGTDAIAIARNFYDKTYTGWEVNADVDFSRYYLAMDVGSWSRTYVSDKSSYKNNGTYWRVGADVNFLLKDPDRNMLFFGLRYGHANFSESMTVMVDDKIWGDFNGVYSNPSVKAHWLELNTGLRVKIWRMIWVGYTARFKFGLKTKGYTDMVPSDVPGYGSTDKDNTWGFNYQIFYRIPVRKQPLFTPPK